MPNALSVHIGVNSVDPAHYDGWSGPLGACEADAGDMVAIAGSQGFRATKLLTRDATRDAVLWNISTAAGCLSAGDIFLLTYAGHGAQVPDTDGSGNYMNEEDDGQDESWCLYDGQLIDDELWEGLCLFREGVRLLVISDSCHSGTVTRAARGAASAPGHLEEAARRGVSHLDQPSYRCLPTIRAAEIYRKNLAFYRAIQGRLPRDHSPMRARLRLISGCQDDQLSLDGVRNGLFTENLLKVWARGAFRGDYATFHRSIASAMPPHQTPGHTVAGPPNPAFDQQPPFTV